MPLVAFLSDHIADMIYEEIRQFAYWLKPKLFSRVQPAPKPVQQVDDPLHDGRSSSAWIPSRRGMSPRPW